MIRVDKLTKRYGSVLALSELTFSVDQGEVVGFVGPNGAGKSTTLRIMTGFLGPSSGRVSIGGIDLEKEPRRARALFGYMPESAALYPELSVIEHLSFRAAARGIARRARRAAVSRAMSQAHVSDVGFRLIGQLSKGYRQRVALADALLGDPPLLILDEPTSGLDPNQIREVRQLLCELRGERTVVLSTHILSEVEAVCDRALVLNRGELVAQGTIAELRARRSALRVSVRDPDAAAQALLRSDRDVCNVHELPGEPPLRHFQLEVASENIGEVSERLVASLCKAGLVPREISQVRAPFEEVFETLTRVDQEPATSGAVTA